MLKLIKYHTSSRAQSLIQYIVIVTLVMASIIIAGPHAIRGWNGHIQALDDSVQDSYDDVLNEAPATDITIPGCDCSWSDQNCDGANTAAGIDCSPYEMLQALDCIPHGCEISSGITPLAQCIPDSTCCTTMPGSVPADCGLAPCQPGEVLSSQTCGGTPPTTTPICIPIAGCNGACSTSLASTYGGWCPGDVNGVPPVPFPFPLTARDPGGCTTTLKCEFECRAPFIAVGGICGCPPLMMEVGGTCVCNPGYYQPQGCPTGQCNQGSCAFGSCYQQ